MSKQSKSVGRRRSRSLVGFASKDLCETIDTSLSSYERLLILIERSFQYALSVVQKELALKDFNIDTFRQKGTECWEKIRSIVEEKNLVKLAVAENTLLNTSFLNPNVGQCNGVISMFQAESDKWSDQISHYREALKKKMDSPYVINASKWEDNDQLYDYSKVVKSASSTHEKLSYQIATLSPTTVIFRQCLQFNKTRQKSLSKRCEIYFRHSKPGSPRTIIKKMNRARVIKPYHMIK